MAISTTLTSSNKRTLHYRLLERCRALKDFIQAGSPSIEDHGQDVAGAQRSAPLSILHPYMDYASWIQYEEHVRHVRGSEYPALQGTIYLDHAGTTPIPRSLIERFSADLTTNLYGNPHSTSASSQLSTRRIEDVRHNALRFFNADPAHFDLVFVANATAGIKLVMDAFRDNDEGFWYGYHRDSHTSLVGVREAAVLGSHCFASDEEVDDWLRGDTSKLQQDKAQQLQLFAYPAQSNMNGRRAPLDWCRRVRRSSQASGASRYSLLDVAALVSTSPLDLSDPEAAPDFTVLSFYKIFGFPGLGALIVRKESADVLRQKRYFGGGTVEMVVALKEQWHVRKNDSLHSALEDGTLPIHNILALRHAMDVHRELFGSIKHVSQHTARLATILYDELRSLRHGNGIQVARLYGDRPMEGDTIVQGPTVAFNLRTSSMAWVGKTEFEKLTSVKNIQVRTGGLCNPGGIASSIGLEPWELSEKFASGERCGNETSAAQWCGYETDIMTAKPTGMIRVSFGATSTLADVHEFMDFLKEFFVDQSTSATLRGNELVQSVSPGEFFVESLTIYPIKSCAAWKIPVNTSWEVREKGLAWDREWCLVHPGTGVALSQKRHPKMALLRPSLDFTSGVLRVKYLGNEALPGDLGQEITVPLSADPRVFQQGQFDIAQDRQSTICGESVTTKIYTSGTIANFFTSVLGVPCQLARFPSSSISSFPHHTEGRLQDNRVGARSTTPRRIFLSNESPILTISRSSLNRLNEQIKARHGKAAQAEVFRANIVVAQEHGAVFGAEQPYAEDDWAGFDIAGARYDMLGACRRCQMVCVDQQTAEKNEEPFVTLAKTRRWDGKVWFGVHTGVAEGQGEVVRIKVGDAVRPLLVGEGAV